MSELGRDELDLSAIRSRIKCMCGHERRDHALAEPYRCCESADRASWHCPCEQFRPGRAARDVGLLLERLDQAEKERDEAGIKWGEHYNAVLAEKDAEIERLTGGCQHDATFDVVLICPTCMQAVRSNSPEVDALMQSIEEYRNAPSGTASAPRSDGASWTPANANNFEGITTDKPPMIYSDGAEPVGAEEGQQQ